MSIPLLTYALLTPVTESRRKKERIIAVGNSNLPDQGLPRGMKQLLKKSQADFGLAFPRISWMKTATHLSRHRSVLCWMEWLECRTNFFPNTTRSISADS